MEIWKDIKGFEGIFQVSNLGRVKSLERYVNNNGTPVLKKECILHDYKVNSGYHQVQLSYNGIIYRKYVHVLVATAFIPNPDNLSDVNHKDEDKNNNCSYNLEWMNHADNVAYSNIKRWNKKPNRDEMKTLLRKYNAVEIARIYGMSYSAITKYCNRNNLPYTREKVLSYSDEEWNDI